MEKLIAIAKRWNSLNNDKEKWRYILDHKDEVGLMLDNDDTYPVFHRSIVPDDIEDYDDLPELEGFEWYIGNSGGIDELMEVLGIQAEGVERKTALR